MQLNQALFMLGGGSGYVPQPDVMRDEAFDPFEKDTLSVEPIIIQLQVCPLPTETPPSRCHVTEVLLSFLPVLRCWELATCPRTAAASCVPSWRWRSAEPITTTASARRTLWVRKVSAVRTGSVFSVALNWFL